MADTLLALDDLAVHFQVGNALAGGVKTLKAVDGVTLDVGVREAEGLTAAALDWAVPGHLEQKVEHYLRALPKEVRRLLVPLAESARSLAGSSHYSW